MPTMIHLSWLTLPKCLQWFTCHFCTRYVGWIWRQFTVFAFVLICAILLMPQVFYQRISCEFWQVSSAADCFKMLLPVPVSLVSFTQVRALHASAGLLGKRNFRKFLVGTKAGTLAFKKERSKEISFKKKYPDSKILATRVDVQTKFQKLMRLSLRILK